MTTISVKYFSPALLHVPLMCSPDMRSFVDQSCDQVTSRWHQGAQRSEPHSLLSVLTEPNRLQSLDRGRTTDETVRVNGQDREFAVRVGQNWDGKTPLPVLYYFNGMRPDGKHEPESFTGLCDRADREGFAVVYMRGSNPGTQTYNNGSVSLPTTVMKVLI